MRIVGKLILVLFLALAGKDVWSQPCTTLGQNPSTAFPVCGATTFTQQNVPICSNGNVPAIGCNNQPTFSTANPYWYKFTCYKSGSLSFDIIPLNTIDEDYDWQLFDITGHNPNDVFTDRTLSIAANWAGTYGATGAGANGTKDFECSSVPANKVNTYATMPNLVQGHEYLLLISHFLSPGQTSEVGYTLTFGKGGGTASIVNPVIPRVQSAYAVCDGTQILVKLSSKINCKTIAANGSDFSIAGTVARNVVGTTGNGCAVGFDSDSIFLQLNNPLAPGNYTVTAKVGTDNNTLTDNCDNILPVGDNAGLSFLPLVPTPLDSIVPVACMRDTLVLVFKKPLLCNTIATDGSDFTISGPAPVSIKSVAGVCNNGMSTIINIILTKPIRTNGVFTITLKSGTDGNTLVDACGQVTPAGSTLSFTTKNITTADFVADIKTGCKSDTAYFTHNAYGGTTQWQWQIDDVALSALQNPVLISKAFGVHNIKLSVSNGACSDTLTRPITFIDNTVKASFLAADTLCPTDTLHFTDKSTANTISWQWNFGNGVTSNIQFPSAQSYNVTGRKANYTARLGVTNALGCADTTYKIITVLASCYIAVPSGFTPNGDGLNDYLYPLNAFKADNMMFSVFNRYGQVLFQTADWTKKWDGRVNGNAQPSGTYVWRLEYTDRDTGKKISLKGTTVLIR